VASDREITLGDVGRAIWRGKWIVLITTVVAARVAFAITFTTETTYTASSKVYLGQATTMMGNIASTPGTNPLTAATMLQGDQVVDVVAKATGYTPGTVRAKTTVAVPRAPGTVTTNQPAIATLSATMAGRDDAVRLANAYAEAALSSANTGYEAVSSTLESQVRRMRAEEARLLAQLRRASTPDLQSRVADLQALTLADLDQEVAREPVDMVGCCVEVVTRLEGAAAERGVLLRGPVAGQDPIVVATNAAHVQTILSNLTTNALRATPPWPKLSTTNSGSPMWCIPLRTARPFSTSTGIWCMKSLAHRPSKA